MKIAIVDLDWFNKVSFLPNSTCMKISSYHQQKGDLVFLAENEYDLTMDYDYMYVYRDMMSGSIPKGIPLRDSRIFLLGKYFSKFYSRYAPEAFTEVMAACRPDYLLYPIKEENKMNKANIVQFYYKGKRLAKIQNFQNAYTKVHYTFVADEGFWDYDLEDIKECVKVLKHCQNIVFQHNISLKSILRDKIVKDLFLSLNFYEGSTIPLVNDCEESRTEEIMEFLLGYKKKHPTHNFPPIHFKSVTLPQNEHPELAIVDFERCLDLIVRAKKQEIRIYIDSPSRADTPFWFYFEELETWCKYRYRESFIEHMFYVNKIVYGMPISNILIDRLKWNTVQSQMFEDLYRRYPDLINKYAYCQWGDREFQRLDLDRIIYRRKHDSIF